MPGDTLGKTYCPEEFVAVVLISLVAVFVRLTVASRTTAPPGSVTIPKTMAELAVCAQAGAADINAASKTLGSMKFFTRIFVASVLSGRYKRGEQNTCDEDSGKEFHGTSPPRNQFAS